MTTLYPYLIEELELQKAPIVSQHVQKTLTVDEHEIFTQTFVSSVNSSGNHIIFVHGYGDVSSRRLPFLKPFLDAGFSLTVYDHPGHGRSSGTHGYVKSLQSLLVTLRSVIDYISSTFHSVNIHLIGESMGGLTVTYYLCENNDNRVKSVALYCPYVGNSPELLPPTFIQRLCRILASFVGWLPLVPAVEGKVHTDPKVEQEFQEYPGTYTKWVRIGTGVVMMDSIEAVQKLFDQFRHPLFIIHGTNDRIALYESSKALYDKAQTESKKFWSVEGGEHELQVENADQMLKQTIEFFQAHQNEN